MTMLPVNLFCPVMTSAPGANTRHAVTSVYVPGLHCPPVALTAVAPRAGAGGGGGRSGETAYGSVIGVIRTGNGVTVPLLVTVPPTPTIPSEVVTEPLAATDSEPRIRMLPWLLTVWPFCALRMPSTHSAQGAGAFRQVAPALPATDGGELPSAPAKMFGVGTDARVTVTVAVAGSTVNESIPASH